MERSYRIWYFLAALLALAPVGARVLLWQKAQPRAADPAMARAGEELFQHVWKQNDPLSPNGDGLGPVFNARSCVACHNQGGRGGGGGVEFNVTTYTVQQAAGAKPRMGLVHANALGAPRETLKDVHPALPAVAQPTLDMLVALPGKRGATLISMPAGVLISQRNTPALFGANWLDAIPDRVIIANEKNQRLKWAMAPTRTEDVPVGRALRRADGRVGRFGWKAQTASLADFVQAACANELGLGNPGQSQPQPLNRTSYEPPGLDLTQEQCDQLTAFITALPRPVERLPDEPAHTEAVPGKKQFHLDLRGRMTPMEPPEPPASRADAVAGKKLFHQVGCADCHQPNLGGVEGIYSDLLLHRMGRDLVGGSAYYGAPPAPVPMPDTPPSDDPDPDEWRTPPLWGVADSAPYLHDGRAETLEEAITLHGGQGKRAAARFQALDPREQVQLVAFLKTLRAP